MVIFLLPPPYHCFLTPYFCSCKASIRCPTVVVQLPHSCGATRITEKKTKILLAETTRRELVPMAR